MFIRDLNRTIENVIKKKYSMFSIINDEGQEENLNEVDVSFKNPSTLSISRTTFNLFLFDIRKNNELRKSDTEIYTYKRLEDSYEVVLPQTKVSCSYFVTVWPHNTGDIELNEHVLIGQLFNLFCGFPNIPIEYLIGCINNGEESYLPAIELAHELGFKNLYEFWTLLKIELRPSFLLKATVSIPIRYYGKELFDKIPMVKDMNFETESYTKP